MQKVLFDDWLIDKYWDLEYTRVPVKKKNAVLIDRKSLFQEK